MKKVVLYESRKNRITKENLVISEIKIMVFPKKSAK